ncbi:MAG: radical SAM protein, partial [Verrucomicrobia bacterium]|nr:radical SAM protein [Verrucomicrobiota bacterium]
LEGVRVLQRAKSAVPKAVTLMGGPHPTCYPDFTLEQTPAIDYLLTGEAELSFPVFADELQKKEPDWSKVRGLVWRDTNGKIAKTPIALEENLDLIEMPDYDATRLTEYIQRGYRYNTAHKLNAPIWFTRGCPYRCGFCSAPKQNGRMVRSHTIDYMVRWVKKLYYEKNIRLFNIIDDGFTTDMKMAKEFCRTMIGLNLPGLRFSTPNGIRAQRTDPELLGLMKQAGWEFVCVAPESGSRRTLKRMNKGIDIDAFPAKVAEIKAAGLKVHGFFIVGYPGETIEDIAETSKLVRKCKFNLVFISNFQPLPGTPIYDELVQAGEIPNGLLPRNYSDGERVYTPSELKNFNFPFFVLKEYLWQALSQPLNIPYILRVISPRMIVLKLWVNFRNLVRALRLPGVSASSASNGATS